MNALLLLNFGEPENATMAEVVPFLERIFNANASIEGGRADQERIAARSRQLALDRAPGLIEEYREIGGSPLLRQARAQAEALAAELAGRGHTARAFIGMQFTEPSIEHAVGEAREAGAEALVGLPVYPLCGPSTTVAALDQMRAAVDALGWRVQVHELTGWHSHPDYISLRAAGIQRLLEENNLRFDEGTRLVFSAHGTPLKYIEEGSRYDIYVRDFCASVARAVGVADYVIGYQNHGNRPGVRWTQPDVESVVEEIEAARIVVDPVSFMHEQSETLAELDHELRETAEGRGLEFFRVPIPYDDPAFIRLLADLAEPFLLADGPLPAGVESPEVGGIPLRQCLCRPTPGTRCLNSGLHR